MWRIVLIIYLGAYITGYEVEKYKEYDLATGPVTGYRYIAERDTITGNLTRITYYLPMTKEELSLSEVYHHNFQALEKAGVTILQKIIFRRQSIRAKQFYQ